MIYKNLQGWTDTQRYFSASLDNKDSILALVGGITYDMSSNASCVRPIKAVPNVTAMTALLC